MIAVLNEVAWANGAYKCVLHCKPELDNFYSKVGYSKKGIEMGNYRAKM